MGGCPLDWQEGLAAMCRPGNGNHGSYASDRGIRDGGQSTAKCGRAPRVVLSSSTNPGSLPANFVTAWFPPLHSSLRSQRQRHARKLLQKTFSFRPPCPRSHFRVVASRAEHLRNGTCLNHSSWRSERMRCTQISAFGTVALTGNRAPPGRYDGSCSGVVASQSRSSWSVFVGTASTGSRIGT